MQSNIVVVLFALFSFVVTWFSDHYLGSLGKIFMFGQKGSLGNFEKNCVYDFLEVPY